MSLAVLLSPDPSLADPGMGFTHCSLLNTWLRHQRNGKSSMAVEVTCAGSQAAKGAKDGGDRSELLLLLLLLLLPHWKVPGPAAHTPHNWPTGSDRLSNQHSLSWNEHKSPCIKAQKHSSPFQPIKLTPNRFSPDPQARSTICSIFPLLLF